MHFIVSTFICTKNHSQWKNNLILPKKPDGGHSLNPPSPQAFTKGGTDFL